MEKIQRLIMVYSWLLSVNFGCASLRFKPSGKEGGVGITPAIQPISPIGENGHLTFVVFLCIIQ